EKLTKLVQGDPKITVQPLKTKYPQGGERTLIAAITGRRLNSSLLPADMGVVVDNVATVVSIYHAVAQSIPLVERVLTITGDAVADPCNFRVRTGTCYKELVEAAGGFKEEPQKLISGGPMMGQALFGLDLPVTKTSSSLTCFTKDEVAAYTPSACIRCGRCLSVCSCRLVPQKMMDAAERGDLELFEKYEGMECVECGTCAYACPARRPLTQAFKEAKVAVRNAKAAKAAAEKAKAEAEKAKAEADKA
ncbi:MAG: RnfABCDGE type electron transport complex subunit C, partial [Lachnospiraceae bacterium]|nr:RnfABCDGE type electron transport complex subunit C [Lachnospiraceae bacterium]